jgi:hypothetical protein
MLSEEQITSELDNCVALLEADEKMRLRGLYTLSTMEHGILRGKIEAYEMILEHGETLEQAQQAHEAHTGGLEFEDYSDWL